MTPEAQRIAITEACPDLWAASGWKWSSGYLVSAEQMRTVDPLNSLDAMHEAEKVLTEAQEDSYEMRLRYRCGKSDVSIKAFNATATERAEAFLSTLNLWKP